MKIKVKINNKWRIAKLLNENVFQDEFCVEINEPGMVGHNIIVVTSDKVKRYETLDEDTDLSKEEWDKVKASVEKALSSLMPGQTVELKDNSLFGYYGSVSLDPSIVEVESIGLFKEMRGWSVNVYKYFNGSRLDPPDVDVVTVFSHINLNSAISEFIKKIFELANNDYWDNQIVPYDGDEE
jgi:hypothetical protein